MIRAVVIITIGLTLGSPALAVTKGVVVAVPSGCSYYAVDAPSGYIVLQWFGGNQPERGDQLVGNMESYGMMDLWNVTAGAETKAWVDEYWLGRTRAIERLRGRCE